MILSFRHKGLRQLFEDDSAKGVNAEHVRRIKQILALPDAAAILKLENPPSLMGYPEAVRVRRLAGGTIVLISLFCRGWNLRKVISDASGFVTKFPVLSLFDLELGTLIP